MIFPKDVETVDLMERLQRRMMRRRIKVNTKGFSKIFKLDENNQYGFAKTKPLPIGAFKKRSTFGHGHFEKLYEIFDPKLMKTLKLVKFLFKPLRLA